jgi:hypothetical protein
MPLREKLVDGIFTPNLVETSLSERQEQRQSQDRAARSLSHGLSGPNDSDMWHCLGFQAIIMIVVAMFSPKLRGELTEEGCLPSTLSVIRVRGRGARGRGTEKKPLPVD